MAKSLRVICRISPNGDNTIPVTSSNTSVSLNAQTFNFDHVYSENTKQSEIFHKEIDILLKEALLGTSGCFFAFGTTQYHIFRSGKSYTIRGGEEGKHRGILTRSAEKLINLIEKETQRHLELKLSVVQIYQDIISDLMVCGSRGMPMTNEENPKIENLTEVSLEKTADLYGNLRYALQMRNSLLKADAKLKTRSHFIVFLKIFENGSEIATISFVDLAGSENASSDKSVYSMNFVSQEEKKSIARTFNIISKVLTYHEGI